MCRFFFAMMDIDSSGYIDKEELRLGVYHLMLPTLLPQVQGGVTDGACIDPASVDELFSAIDLSHNGRIEFNEFEIFYNSLLH